MTHVDLHIHSYYSDGTDSPSHVVAAAKLKGLELIAIADHDNLRGFWEAIAPAKKAGIGLVPAVEITTIDHHLLALDFDPYDKDFSSFVDHSRDTQRFLCEQRVDLLKAQGIPISLDKVEKRFPCSTLTKYSISKTMTEDPECKEYLLKNHEPEKDGTIKIRSILTYYLSEGMIAGTVEKVRWIDWEEAIEAVHKAGGLAIIAHAAIGADNPKYIPHLLAGVDGIEVQPQFWDQYIPFKEYAESKGLLVSYGSDFHGKAFDPDSKMLGRERNQLSQNFLDRLRHVQY